MTKSGDNTWSGDDSAAFLRERADQAGVKLPPLAKTPARWPRLLHSPSGTPLDLGQDPKQLAWRVLRSAWPLILVQTLALSVGSVLGALLPVFMGNSVDDAVNYGLTAPTLISLGIFTFGVLVMSVGDGINQIAEVASYLWAALGSSRAVAHRVIRAGRAGKTDQPPGDVVTAILNDSDQVGSAAVFVAEALAAVAAFVAVAVVMFKMAPPLAWVVIVGLPLSIIGVTFLVKPMERKQSAQREEQGRLTTISSDAVSGLRVLRGVGGEDFYNARYQAQSQKVKEAGIKVAGNQAALAVIRSAVPQLFMAVVVGVGALLTLRGQLTAGQLVAFFAMTVYLRNPINVAAWVVQVGTRSWVGMKKLSQFHAAQPAVSDSFLTNDLAGDEDEGLVSGAPALDWSADFAGLPLHDPVSGVRVPPGQVTALVAANPDLAAGAARRLARTDDADQALLGKTDLRQIPLDQVRAGILLAEADAQLFSGPLHWSVRGAATADPAPRGVTELVYREHLEEAARHEGSLYRPDRVPQDPRLEEALRIADAGDAVDSLPGGVAGWLTERGRNLSGGQRQRVALARAVYADPPILLAVEPTSAVDSHTEERIARALVSDRAGQTTLVVTASPLWLEKCDHIIFLDDQGQAVAEGTHQQLRDHGEYARVIARETGGDR